MKIVTVEQMRTLESASARNGVSADTLMENAGLGVAFQATQLLASPRGARVVVLVGPGNNGGDGLVAARHLHQWGARVQLYLCGSRKASDRKLEMARERGIPSTAEEDDPNLALLQSHLTTASLIIDAILGTGTARPIEGRLKEVLSHVGRARKEHPIPLLAVDIPTGVDAASGAVDPVCLGADVTVTLGHPKVGHYTFPGASVTGRLEILDIGIPPGLDANVSLELITPELVRSLLPKRPLEGNKGTFGRLLVVAGARSYVGAAILACNGAYRTGAGLVTLAAPRSVDAIAASGGVIEATHLPLHETEAGVIAFQSVSTVQEAMGRYEALLIGCGLSQESEVKAFVQALLLEDPRPEAPAILDADALNILASLPNWWEELKTPSVLTPHPGEMARLTGLSTAQVQASRLDTTRQAAKRWGQVVVLKGAFTVVASPEGTTWLSPYANPALASAGTGDVLAGAIGGLLAQGLPPQHAAVCGVYLHANAAEELRADLGEAGLVASDLLLEIPRRIRGLSDKSG